MADNDADLTGRSITTIAGRPATIISSRPATTDSKKTTTTTTTTDTKTAATIRQHKTTDGRPDARGTDRKTARYLTRFERARILGARATEISQGRGEPPMIDWSKIPESTNPAALTDALAMAEEELRQGRTPLNIRRVHADDSSEDWTVAELIWLDDMPASVDFTG